MRIRCNYCQADSDVLIEVIPKTITSFECWRCHKSIDLSDLVNSSDIQRDEVVGNSADSSSNSCHQMQITSERSSDSVKTTQVGVARFNRSKIFSQIAVVFFSAGLAGAMFLYFGRNSHQPNLPMSQLSNLHQRAQPIIESDLNVDGPDRFEQRQDDIAKSIMVAPTPEQSSQKSASLSSPEERVTADILNAYQQFIPIHLNQLRPKLEELIESGQQPLLRYQMILGEIFAYLGGKYDRRQWIERSMDIYQQVISSNPKFQEVKRIQVLAYHASRQYLQAYSLAQSLPARLQKDPVIRAIMDLYLLDAGQEQQALQSLEQLHRKFPAHYFVTESLASAYLSRDNFRAEKLLLEILAVDRTDVSSINKLVELYLRMERFAEVLSIYHQNIDMNILSDLYRLRASTLLNRLGRHLEAEKLLDHILTSLANTNESGPLHERDRAAIYTEKAVIYRQQNNLKEALAWQERALKILPNSLVILSQYADDLYHLQKLDQAVAIYQKALAIDPEHGHIRKKIAQIAVKQNKFDVALEHLQWLTARGGRDADVMFWSARVWHAQGDHAKALMFFEQGFSLNPAHTDAIALKTKLDQLQTPTPHREN